MADWRENDERRVNETLHESKERLEQLAANWSRFKEKNRHPKVGTVNGKDAIIV